MNKQNIQKIIALVLWIIGIYLFITQLLYINHVYTQTSNSILKAVITGMIVGILVMVSSLVVFLTIRNKK